MARAPTISVEIRYDDETRRLIQQQIEEHMSEIEAAATEIPRTTLADLLGFDLAESTPTWDALFQAVDELMEVRRG